MNEARRNFFRRTAIVAADFTKATSAFYAGTMVFCSMTRTKETPPVPYAKLVVPAAVFGAGMAVAHELVRQVEAGTFDGLVEGDGRLVVISNLKADGPQADLSLLSTPTVR